MLRISLGNNQWYMGPSQDGANHGPLQEAAKKLPGVAVCAVFVGMSLKKTGILNS